MTNYKLSTIEKMVIDVCDTIAIEGGDNNTKCLLKILPNNTYKVIVTNLSGKELYSNKFTSINSKSQVVHYLESTINRNIEII